MNPSAALLDDPVVRAARTRADGSAESRLRIDGITCAACAGIIETALRGVPGVLDARVHAATERARVRWDPARVQLSALAETLAPLGYRLRPDSAASAHDERQRERRIATWRLFVAGFCMMQVMMLALPLYVAAPGEMPADQRALLVWGSWVMSLPVLLFSARPFYTASWRQLRAGRIGMDVPVALAIGVGYLASSVAAFDPAGPLGSEVWFDSITMFVFLLLGARWLEQRLRHRVAAELERAVERLPASVQRIAADGSAQAVAPEALRIGDRVRVAAGEAFAADGCVVEGRTRADEALLTGESTPCAKQPGDAVVAGSVNLEAPVLMQVERLGADTRYQAIVALMREAFEQRPRLLHAADRVASWMLGGVLLLALLGGLAWSFVDPARALWVVTAVLVVTCPCALSLAAPAALLVSAGTLARRGVLVQRLDALEAIARMQQLFVDKTGTLTHDRLEFAGAFDVGGRPLRDDAALLREAASLAAWSRHPLARSLVEHAGAAAGAVWSGVEEVPGAGLRARDATGNEVRLGSAAWLGINEPALPAGPLHWYGPVGHPVRLQFRECLRADAEAAVHELRRDGVALGLLSGDRPERVAAVARRLGIDNARGAATPADKLAALAAAQAGGRIVGMLGDGINDAPVLARADVSIAMGQGAAIAKRGADLIVMSERLADVARARRQAQRTLRVIRQNLAFSLVYNATCIPLALAGWLPPWLAGAGMAASSLLVLLNALRLRRA